MSNQDQKYDVAISFLHRDELVASEIHQRLAEHFSVFVYPKRQEELAGTNGLESFREAFRVESRLVVVLYREGWGKTPFTRVEEDAIIDRFRDDGWDFLLFGWCWHVKSSTDFYTASSLADELLKTLLNLQDRFEKGDIKSSDNQPRHYKH